MQYISNAHEDEKKLYYLINEVFRKLPDHDIVITNAFLRGTKMHESDNEIAIILDEVLNGDEIYSS